MPAMSTATVMVVAQSAELVAFDPGARLERACELIVDAGQAGADWILFPEAYLPGGPAWLWAGLQGDADVHALQALALAAAVVIPGEVSDRLCRVARRSRVGVAIGWIATNSAATAACCSSMRTATSAVTSGPRSAPRTRSRAGVWLPVPWRCSWIRHTRSRRGPGGFESPVSISLSVCSPPCSYGQGAGTKRCSL